MSTIGQIMNLFAWAGCGVMVGISLWNKEYGQAVLFFALLTISVNSAASVEVLTK